MASRRLWLIIAAELVTYALLIAILRPALDVRIGVLAIAVPLTMLAVRIAIVLASFLFAASVQRSPPLPLLAWLRMIRGEIAAFLRFQILIATHPRNDNAQPARDVDAPLVVLLHGIYCNGAVWRPLAQNLRLRTGCEVRTPDLQPPTASLEQQAEAFAQWLQAVGRSNEASRVIVITHSLGGLVVREYLRSRPRVSLKVICIGTPHRGTAVARALRTAIGRDLRQNCAALARLELAPTASDLMNIYSLHDNLVVPAASSALPGARNRAVCGYGHMALIYSSEIRALLCAEITRASRRVGEPSVSP